MSESIQGWTRWVVETREASGLGVCCREAQADGVPCGSPESDCPLCGRGSDARTLDDLGEAGLRIVSTEA
jgi:hypothetical protein